MHRFRILVPVSFGAQSDIALKQAKGMALQLNAMITCLHVIEQAGIMSSKLFTKKMEQNIRLESEIKLASKVEGILSGNKGLSFELIVTSGKVYRKILEKSTEMDIDLIIMGRSDTADSTKPLLGSNASKVIERSDIPVLTIKGMENISNRHVLVPLDLSAPVGLQLSKTIEIAKLLNAIVTIFTILHSSDISLEASYRGRLLEIKKLFSHYGIFCRAKLMFTERKVADKIISCLARYHADLLVLMTQNESGIAELSLGTVANELICKSEIPVLSLTPVIQEAAFPYNSISENICSSLKHCDPNDQLIPTD